jgi:hypothetical protein
MKEGLHTNGPDEAYLELIAQTLKFPPQIFLFAGPPNRGRPALPAARAQGGRLPQVLGAARQVGGIPVRTPLPLHWLQGGRSQQGLLRRM